jgi:hypothetical protein
MNTYIADSIARQHADAMLADAAAARRVRRARTSGKARAAAAAGAETAGHSPVPSASRRSAAVAHFVTRPFTAASGWLAAGQL